jgi:hypothetical protein
VTEEIRDLVVPGERQRSNFPYFSPGREIGRSSVALKIDPKVRAQLFSRATTITQPNAMNSQRSTKRRYQLFCEVNLRVDVLGRWGRDSEDFHKCNLRIAAAKFADERKRVLHYLAHIHRNHFIRKCRLSSNRSHLISFSNA